MIIEKRSLNGTKTRKTERWTTSPRITVILINLRQKSFAPNFASKSKKLQNEIIDIDTKIQEIDWQIVDPDALKMTQKNFLNQLNQENFKMRAGDPVEEDILARKLFLNIEIDAQKGLSVRWREPFNLLLKTTKNGFGARDWT